MTTIYSKEYQQVVKRLRRARQEAGLTQKKVAAKIGKPQSFVSKYESGERRLDITELKKIAEIYKKNINYFIKD